MLRFMFFLMSFIGISPLLFAHEQLSVTRIEFQASEKRHCYTPEMSIHFQSISLQTKFLISGADLQPFSPKAGLDLLKKNTAVSIFTNHYGFDWGTCEFPKDFTVEIKKNNPFEEQYSGTATVLPEQVPWFQNEFFLVLQIRDLEGKVLQVLHQGKIANLRCYVEYQGGGLSKQQLDSQDPHSNNCLSLIRAGVSLQDFQFKAPAISGHYQLYAEFYNKQNQRLGQGIRFFEVAEQAPTGIHLFAGVQVEPVMKKGQGGTLRLKLLDGNGKEIRFPQEGYIREVFVNLMKETGSPNMNDTIVRDFHWLPMPPNFKAQFPFEIPFNDAWLKFFGEGTIYFSFTVVREYIQTETIRVSGSFQIKF